jgi:2-polyprenyl-6-methoxyphenol 4-hydroxylase
MLIHTPKSEYDIVVVGAGMVGASFAHLLRAEPACASLSMLVVEAVLPASTEQPSFDARSTALSFGSRKIFEKMGVWQDIAEFATAIEKIQVSDKGHFGSVWLDCAEHKQQALGYVMENSRLGRVLNPLLMEAEGIDYLAPAKIHSARPRQSCMQLQIDARGEQLEVSANLVVLADGGRSPICADLGITQKRKDYEQQALIANVAFSQPHEHVAYERFTEQGPLAILPLADYEEQHRGALVWTLRAENVSEVTSLDEQELLAELNNQFGQRLGKITQIGQRFTYPLSLSVATEQVRPHLVLLGNVAHTLHPVAGQGLNLALRAADSLVQQVQKGKARGEAPGEMSVLQAYQESRNEDQQATIALTDSMIRMFSTNQLGPAFARKAGLLAVDLLPGIRKGFGRQAMGLHAW